MVVFLLQVFLQMDVDVTMHRCSAHTSLSTFIAFVFFYSFPLYVFLCVYWNGGLTSVKKDPWVFSELPAKNANRQIFCLASPIVSRRLQLASILHLTLLCTPMQTADTPPFQNQAWGGGFSSKLPEMTGSLFCPSQAQKSLWSWALKDYYGMLFLWQVLLNVMQMSHPPLSVCPVTLSWAGEDAERLVTCEG